MRRKLAASFVFLCFCLYVFIFVITNSESDIVDVMFADMRMSDIDKNMENHSGESVESGGYNDMTGDDEGKDLSTYSDEAEDDNQGIFDTDTARVLISTSDYADIYHNKITFFNADGFTVKYEGDGRTESVLISDEELTIDKTSGYFINDVITVYPGLAADDNFDECVTALTSVSRKCGTPEYYGYFEIRKTSQGLLLINIVSVEKYVASVVCSELNTGFPDEALKAQAICARTYFYYVKSTEKYIDYDADILDSKSSQVYNNNEYSSKIENIIMDTAGRIITYDGEPINAVYFSTSCGSTTVGDVFNRNDMDYTYSNIVADVSCTLDLTDETVFKAFIKDASEALPEGAYIYDSRYPYYRWSLYESVDEIRNAVAASTGTDVGTIEKIVSGTRLEGGVLSDIIIYGSDETIVINGQDNIRGAMCADGVSIVLNDERSVSSESLPSAFFYMDAVYEDGELLGFNIYGGGYGHGCGMSQNAAKKMAERGMSCEEIINFFYTGINIETAE